MNTAAPVSVNTPNLLFISFMIASYSMISYFCWMYVALGFINYLFPIRMCVPLLLCIVF